VGFLWGIFLEGVGQLILKSLFLMVNNSVIGRSECSTLCACAMYVYGKVDISLRIKVIVAFSPALSLLTLLVIAMVGRFVSDIVIPF
jgi:hypothetical protein